MPSFISLLDLTSSRIIDILNRADALETAFRENRLPATLKSKSIGFWIEESGFRNRTAFALGAELLGGHPVCIPGKMGSEPIADVANLFDGWLSFLVASAAQHEDLQQFGDNAKISMLNAGTDYNSPCSLLADLQYIRRCRGSLEGLQVVFVGELTSRCMSWFEAAARLPVKVVQVVPPGFEADSRLVHRLNYGAVGEIKTDFELGPYLAQADVLYTDAWPEMHTETAENKVRSIFSPYQVTPEKLSGLNRDALFLPVFPVSRGNEVSKNAMELPCQRSREANYYLLHAQNAIMEFTAGIL